MPATFTIALIYYSAFCMSKPRAVERVSGHLQHWEVGGAFCSKSLRALQFALQLSKRSHSYQCSVTILIAVLYYSHSRTHLYLLPGFQQTVSLQTKQMTCKQSLLFAPHSRILIFEVSFTESSFATMTLSNSNSPLEINLSK